MSILEAKRLQGFFESDILIGRPKSAFKIIGNSVCRQVAFALGVKLAEAVRKGLLMERLTQMMKTEKPSKVNERGASMKFMVLIETREKRDNMDTDMHREQYTCTTRNLRSGDFHVDVSAGEITGRLGISIVEESPHKRNEIVLQDGVENII